MHAGLLMAQEVLARNKSIPDNRKYMVLVSDGDSYLYCKGGDYTKAYSRSYIAAESAGGAYAYGGYYDEGWYCPSSGYEDKASGKKNVKRPTTSSQSDWEAYLNDVRDRNQESNGDIYDFEWKYYDESWDKKIADQVKEDGFKTQPAVPRSASNLDMGFLNAASVYHTLAAKYHCYAMAVPSWNTADGGHSAFMGYLNNGAENGFESIKNQILYLVGAGSSVTDTIGDRFDLTDPAQMKLTVDDEQGNSKTYNAETIGENQNQYGFLKQGDGTYAYKVTYTPDDKDKKTGEQIVWTTYVPITNFQHVSLTYQVKLKDSKTEPGTYGQLDLNGDGLIDGTNTAVDSSNAIYTNESALLSPKDSAGNEGTSEEFGKPSVSYTVEKTAPTEPTTPVTPSEPEQPQKHEVTIHEENPTSDKPETTTKITVDDQGKVEKPADPVRPGYKFDGWYSDPECTIPFDFSKPVTGDIHIYAKWNKNVKPQTAKKVTGILLPKAIANGNSRQTVTWTPLTNVDGYYVYEANCNTPKKTYHFKKVADVKASAPRVYKQSGLKKGVAYKYYVAAYQIKNGKKKVVKKSLSVHSIAGNLMRKRVSYTNVKKVSVNKNAVTLKVGKTYRIQPSVKGVFSNCAILQKGHAAMFRYVYIKDGKNISVSSTGIVKAEKAGKCNVYVLGTNGVRARVAVTVK